MKFLTGLEAKLLVSGVALEEYEGNAAESGEDHVNTMHRYVQSVPGSVFAISITAPRNLAPAPHDILRCDVYLDGKYAMNRMCDLTNTPADTPYNVLIDRLDHMTPRGREVQLLEFSQLSTTDNPIPATAKPDRFKHLGLVRVRCRWARKVSAPYIDMRDSFTPTVDTGIPEKCLKGRSISTRVR